MWKLLILICSVCLIGCASPKGLDGENLKTRYMTITVKGTDADCIPVLSIPSTGCDTAEAKAAPTYKNFASASTQKGEICAERRQKIGWILDNQREGTELSIRFKAENPFKCKLKTKKGILDCRIRGDAEKIAYEYGITVSTCKNELDPRIFVY